MEQTEQRAGTPCHCHDSSEAGLLHGLHWGQERTACHGPFPAVWQDLLHRQGRSTPINCSEHHTHRDVLCVYPEMAFGQLLLKCLGHRTTEVGHSPSAEHLWWHLHPLCLPAFWKAVTDHIFKTEFLGPVWWIQQLSDSLKISVWFRMTKMHIYSFGDLAARF